MVSTEQQQKVHVKAGIFHGYFKTENWNKFA